MIFEFSDWREGGVIFHERKHPCSKFTNSSFALDGCTLMCTRNPIHINIYGINWNQSK